MHTQATQGMMVAEAWCNSLDYQPLEDLRINELTEDGAAAVVERFHRASLWR